MASVPDSSLLPSSSSSIFPHRNLRIPEDTLFYAIYPDLPSSSSSSSSAAAEEDVGAALRSLQLHLNSIIAPLTHDYIWQHEPFHLLLPPNPNDSSTRCPLCNSPSAPHLHGKIRYGSNLEDEWFAVYLLYELSRAVPSISIRAWDSDGEFLLIEAAFALPSWLEPHSSRHRVFIRRGELHIVPKSLFRSNPSLQDALKAIRDDEIDTRASAAVQSAVNKRLSGYPERAQANMHRARLIVPLPVAQVLKHEPCLISLMVEGFYDRDVDSMKHAAKMERFLRGNDGEVEMVRTCVRMSRAMYGQLVQQRFQAPRCYPMPGRDEGPGVFMEAELGMKITCGLEMMYQERKRAGEEGKGVTWEAFKQSLQNSGCFEGLPGSKEYQRIMDGALEYYRNSSLFSRTRDMMNAPVHRIDEILSLPYSSNDFKSIDLPPGDDDSWLYNGEEDLDSAILERQKELEMYESEHRKQKETTQQKVKGKDSGLQSNDFKLGDIAESMQAFIQKISSFEGAEVPQNRDSEAVELDVDRFMKEIESVMAPAWREGTTSDVKFEEGYTSSMDMDFDESEDGYDIAEQPGGSGAEDDFMESYSDVLNKELNETTLKRSFIQAHQHAKANDEGKSSAPKDMDMDEGFTPVDVDLNLVQSLLDSFSSQQGLPGPASNLLGLMGVKVPQDAKKV